MSCNTACAGSALYIGADMDVEYTGAQDREGTFLNSGTCTWQLFTAAGVSVATGTLTYDTGSDGDYYGVIESTVTAGLTADAPYYVIITFVQGAYNDSRKLNSRAAYRS